MTDNYSYHQEPAEHPKARQVTGEPELVAGVAGAQGDITHADATAGAIYPGTLLSDNRLNGRGNTPVRAAILQTMQQTYGNRATQRVLQRLKAGQEATQETDIAERIQAKAGSGEDLGDDVRKQLESGLGADLSRVRVHTDGEADKMAHSVDAVAFTTGNDIFFREGAYSPSSSEGLHLLAHEATHTVQQSAGPVSGTPAPGGVSISDPSDTYEQAAESAAARVTSGSKGQRAEQTGSAPVQRQGSEEDEEAPSIQRTLALGASLPVQRFGSQEHQSLGNSATKDLTVNAGGEKGDEKFELNYGDIVALTGDYFLATKEEYPPELPYNNDDLFTLAKKPGDNGKKAGTRDEIIYVLYLINPDDSRFKPKGPWVDYPPFSEEVINAVTERYQKLATSNTSHFAAPRGRKAGGKPIEGPQGEGSAGSSYRDLHETAIRMAYHFGYDKSEISPAIAMEAAAQHFLTDAFSAGHLRTEIGNMREYWQEKYPLFWFNLRHKIALDTAVQMNEQDSNPATYGGTVKQMYEAIAEQVEGMAASLPAVTIGDLLSKVFHDYDSENGVIVVGGGKVFGDDHLDDNDPENKTRKLAEAAIRWGLADIQKAFDMGKSGSKLTDEQLYEAVRARSHGHKDQYVAETMMPKPDPSEPGQNWKADSFEALWDMPIVGTSGPKIGDRIADQLKPGNEVRDTLDHLAEKFPEVQSPDLYGVPLGDLHPRQAFRDGFVAPMVADPKAALLNTINWAPSYGLADNNKDDVSLATGQELDKQGQLPGMTTPARVSYVKELVGGYTQGDEPTQVLVMRLFETAPASERPVIYEQVEGHKWTGDWIHGVFASDDNLWNALSSDRLNTLKDLINNGWTGK